METTTYRNYTRELLIGLNEMQHVNCFCESYRNIAVCSSGIPKLAVEIRDIQKFTQPPAQRGSEAYVQFVATLKRVIAPIYDQNIRRCFVSCMRNLEVSSLM